MANINKQITLTSKENSAGPYFDVYYSTDCINYTICIDGSAVYLPSISSTAIVTVPDNTICIKLVNKNANCGNNEFIDAFGTTTTTSTTTTTIPPSTTTTTIGTTTTTTISGTTTSTTTQACYNCDNGTIAFSTSAIDYGQYPTRDVCPGSNECGLFIYNAVDRPNRFNLYDSTGLVATSGWVGYATWPGPWGSSLSVSPSGQFSYDFASTSGRYVLVEYGPADPDSPTSDTAEWSMTCGSCGTTTTTTIAPTTTTTTLGPTTTTTTAAFTCFNWNSSRCNAPGDCVIQYTDCNNNPVTASVNYEQAATVCSPNAPTVTQGTMNTFNNIGGCGYLPTTTTTTLATSATLDWQFTETNSNGSMTLYVNGNVIETRTSSANSTYTVYQGDVIYCEISAGNCSGFSDYANAYTLGIIADAACGVGSTSLTSYSYTVVSGDLGNTISLDMFASCDGGCV